jgi:hypothetical protein
VRTWSPKGQTPVLEFNFNWKKLSAIAGLSWWNFYFRLYPGAIKTEQVIDFLKHLQRHAKGKLLIVWDGVATHRSQLVHQYLQSLRGKIWVERLPAYAPELNRWSTSGATGNSTSYRTCAPVICGNFPAGLPMPCAASAVNAPTSSALSGNKLNFPSRVAYSGVELVMAPW